MQLDKDNAKDMGFRLFIGNQYIYGYSWIFYKIVAIKDIVKIASNSKSVGNSLYKTQSALLIWTKNGKKIGYGYYQNKEVVRRAMDKILTLKPDVVIEEDWVKKNFG